MMSFNDMTSKDFLPDYCTVVMFGEFRYRAGPEEPSFDDPKEVQVFYFCFQMDSDLTVRLQIPPD